MSENPEGILSNDEAAEMLMEPEKETPKADEAQTDEPEPKEDEAETETEDDAPEEDADGDPEDADSDEDEGEVTEDEDEEKDLVEVFDGKEWTPVDREEAKGYGLRQADYTRKTMEVAETKKALEAERETVQNQTAQLKDALARVAIPTEQQPNWAEMAATMDPREYNQAQAQWAEQQAQADQARQYYQEMQAQEHQEQMKAEQEQLFEAFPDWREPEVFQRAAQEMTTGLTHYGFSEEEIGSMMDHRLFRVAKDALKYRALEKAKPEVKKKVAKAPKRLKPGSKVSKRQQHQADSRHKIDRLKQTGSLDDAMEALFT